MRRFCGYALVALILSIQPGCISKLWKKPPPVEELDFDVYGKVASMSAEQLVVDTKQGRLTFLLGTASVKGSDTFDEGQVVHVFYKKLAEGNVITLVVKKVN